MEVVPMGSVVMMKGVKLVGCVVLVVGVPVVEVWKISVGVVRVVAVIIVVVRFVVAQVVAVRDEDRSDIVVLVVV